MSIKPDGDYSSLKPWPEGAVDDWQRGASYGFIAHKYGRAYSTVVKLIARQKELGTERLVATTNSRRATKTRYSDMSPISAMHQAVGIKINKYRELQNDYNYEELGRLLGTNRMVARKMELGIHDFTMSQLSQISTVLQIPLEELIRPSQATR